MGVSGVGRKLLQPAIAGLTVAHKRQQAQARLLMAELALHAYRLDHEDNPKGLADLVPDYLPSIPEDPFGNHPLIYMKGATGPILYSVGPDGRDDGGRPIPATSFSPTARGDFRIDLPESIPEKGPAAGGATPEA